MIRLPTYWENNYVFKGFKTRNNILQLKQKNICIVSIYWSTFFLFQTGLCWLYWSRWMSTCSPVDQGQATVAQQARQGDWGGDGWWWWWRLWWQDEHQYNASALLLRGLLIFSMFFRIMSCNVTCVETEHEEKHKERILVNTVTLKFKKYYASKKTDHDIHIDFWAPKLWSSDWCIPSHQSLLLCADNPPINIFGKKS